MINLKFFANIRQADRAFTQILSATDFSMLAEYRDRIVALASDVRKNSHPPSMAAKLLSELHLCLQQRCIALTIEEMQAKKFGPPPTAFALVIMGSGSRQEMLLMPDQDNGIILADTSVLSRATNHQWFEEFCLQVTRHLDEVGYAYCPGDIMATNPLFHKTLAEWQQQITHIASSPTPKAARWANIVLDFSTLYGEANLTQKLYRHTCQELKRHPRLLKMMVEDDAESQVPLNWFNRLTTQNGKIDIKRNGLRILTDATRIYAIQYGITHRNTLERLGALQQQGVIDGDARTAICQAFETLLDLVLQHQIQQQQQQQPLDTLIELSNWLPPQQKALQIAMRTVKQLQQKLQVDFDTLVF